jgi:DNA-directed RNA polymerase subunit RPC12/RpoP
MTNTFSTDIRLYTCPSCGAPLKVSPAGGQLSCEYCRASIVVDARNDSWGGGGVRPTEEERMSGLWAQAAQFMNTSIPSEMQQLVQSQLTDDNFSQALGLWTKYCDWAKQGREDAAEWAVLFTAALSNYLGQKGDDLRRRAVFETTLDAVPGDALKQVMRCRMARAALKAGETDAARSWLAGCDSAASDLQADAEYRLTAAYIATADRDFAKVAQILGTTAGGTPVPLPIAVLTDFARANAVEKLGDVASAASIIEQSARRWSVSAQMISAMAAAGAWLDLCTQSAPSAVQALATNAGPAAGGTAASPSVPAPPAGEHKRHGLFKRG